MAELDPDDGARPERGLGPAGQAVREVRRHGFVGEAGFDTPAEVFSHPRSDARVSGRGGMPETGHQAVAGETLGFLGRGTLGPFLLGRDPSLVTADDVRTGSGVVSGRVGRWRTGFAELSSPPDFAGDNSLYLGLHQSTALARLLSLAPLVASRASADRLLKSLDEEVSRRLVLLLAHRHSRSV